MPNHLKKSYNHVWEIYLIMIIFVFYCRTLLDQTVSELKHQVSLLKSRESKVIDQNRELQHTMIDMETKLDDMQERNQTALDMVRHDAISPPPVIETARGGLRSLSLIMVS